MSEQLQALPEIVAHWLNDKHIALGKPTEDPGQSVWAEWDGVRGVLYLGWWEESQCPRCQQPDRQPQHPLNPPEGFDTWGWQHGCGEWWEPYSVTLKVDDELAADEQLFEAKLNEMLATLRDNQDQIVGKVTAQLRTDLRVFLETYPEDDRADNATGSEIEPGIWKPEGGKWEAWDYDPTTTAEGETVTVTEDDLAEAQAN